MIDQKMLQMMYQQWIQENETYVLRWFDFVEMAANHMMSSQAEVMKVLMRCSWFERPEE
jgi:hypothetical protein